MQRGTSGHPGVGSVVLLPVSAEGTRSLATLASYYAGILDPGDVQLGDLAYTAGVLRSHGRWRRAQVVADVTAAREWLAGLAQEETPPVGEAGPVAFVFSGQGNQWPGMGRGLYAAEPVARASLEECDDLLRHIGGWSLLDVLADPSAGTGTEDPGVLQPVLVALQVTIARQLAHWGLTADAYLGHSLGEISAAAAGGALALAEALELACLRGRLMRAAGGSGRTALLGVPEREATDRIAAAGGHAEIAGWNGPASMLVAGREETVRAVVEALAAEERFARVLPGTVAFHSSFVASIAEHLGERASFLSPRPTGALFVSTVTGTAIDPSTLDARYWAGNLRRPVRFMQAVHELAGRGYRTFVEIGAHPTLAPSLHDCLAPPAARRGGTPLVVPTLRRDADERGALLTSAGMLYEAGYAVDFSAMAGPGRRPLRLAPPRPEPPRPEPPRPEPPRPEPAAVPAYAQVEQVFPGLRVWCAAPARRAEPGRFTWEGTPLASFALVARTAMDALVARGDSRRINVRLEIGARLTADGDEICVAVPTGEKTVEVRLGTGDGWTTQATAALADATDGSDRIDLAAVRTRCAPEHSAGAAYGDLAALGLTPVSRLADRLARGPEGETLLRLRPMPAGPAWSLIDGMLHGAVLAAAAPSELFLPFECAVLHAPRDADPVAARWLHLGPAERRDDGNLERRAAVLDNAGRVLAEAERLVLQRVPVDVLETLARQERARPTVGTNGSAAEALVLLDPADRVRAVTELVRTEVGQVLRVPPSRVDTARALNHLGVDSIMGLELQRRLESTLHAEIKIVQMLRGDSIDDLAADLSRRLGETVAPAVDPALPSLDDPREVERLLARMDEMSGEDVDALLQRLSERTAEPS